jgi:hypothetical protein
MKRKNYLKGNLAMTLFLGCLFFVLPVYSCEKNIPLDQMLEITNLNNNNSEDKDLLVNVQHAYLSHKAYYQTPNIYFFNSEQNNVACFLANNLLENIFAGSNNTEDDHYESILLNLQEQENKSACIIQKEILTFLLTHLYTFPETGYRNKFLYEFKYLLYKVNSCDSSSDQDNLYQNFYTTMQNIIVRNDNFKFGFMKRMALIGCIPSIILTPIIALISFSQDGYANIPTIIAAGVPGVGFSVSMLLWYLCNKQGYEIMKKELNTFKEKSKNNALL